MRSSAFIGNGGTLALIILSATASAAASDGRLPLRVGTRALQVEVAATPLQREHGLMGHTRLAADGGMLFVFERAGRPCFWMRNTSLPLSIAFIGASGRIVSLADMQPDSDTLHCSDAEVRYALEVPQGEFLRRKITTGAQVDGLPQ